MIKRSEKEIKEFVEQHWPGAEKHEIRFVSDGHIEITLTSMYESPGLSFADLKALAEFFDTDNIGDADRIAMGGCETCDYGSSYGFTLAVKERIGT